MSPLAGVLISLASILAFVVGYLAAGIRQAGRSTVPEALPKHTKEGRDRRALNDAERTELETLRSRAAEGGLNDAERDELHTLRDTVARGGVTDQERQELQALREDAEQRRLTAAEREEFLWLKKRSEQQASYIHTLEKLIIDRGDGPIPDGVDSSSE